MSSSSVTVVIKWHSVVCCFVLFIYIVGVLGFLHGMCKKAQCLKYAKCLSLLGKGFLCQQTLLTTLRLEHQVWVRLITNICMAPTFAD